MVNMTEHDTAWVEAEDAAAIVEQHLVGGTPWADKLTPAEIW